MPQVLLTWMPLYAAIAAYVALVYHGALAMRRLAAKRRTTTDRLATHAEILRVEMIAVLIVAAAIGARAYMMRPMDLVVFWGILLYAMIVSAVVYWRYPSAIPLPSDNDLKMRGSFVRWVNRGLRYLSTAVTSILCVVVLGAILLSST